MMTRDQLVRLALGMGDEQAVTPVYRDPIYQGQTSAGNTQSQLQAPWGGGTTQTPPSGVSGDMIIQALTGLGNKNASGANPGNNNGRVFNPQISTPQSGVQQGWQSLLPGLLRSTHPAYNPLVYSNIFDQRKTPMSDRWGNGATMFSPWGY